MANVLSEDKRHKVEALGRLGWLRRIEREAQVRRQTASAYLKAAGIEVRGRGGGKAKPATSDSVITDSADPKPGTSESAITDSADPKPATPESVITDSAVTTVCSCEPYREPIARWLGDGRTTMSIWHELVEQRGFAGRYSAVTRGIQHVTLRSRLADQTVGRWPPND